MRRTSPLIVNEVKRLSQEEGMYDEEIAEAIGYHRVTVQRIRKEYGIPKYNINKRKDKETVCPYCEKVYLIRRDETPGICCPECVPKVNLLASVSK